eukprot:SAG31_NODE_12923_length_906_cov_1.197026_2_plen_66_part_01
MSEAAIVHSDIPVGEDVDGGNVGAHEDGDLQAQEEQRQQQRNHVPIVTKFMVLNYGCNDSAVVASV